MLLGYNLYSPHDWDAPETCDECGEGIDCNTPHYREMGTNRILCDECACRPDDDTLIYYDRGEDKEIKE